MSRRVSSEYRNWEKQQREYTNSCWFQAESRGVPLCYVETSRYPVSCGHLVLPAETEGDLDDYTYVAEGSYRLMRGDA